MAKKISELLAAAAPGDTDLFPTVQSLSTKKQTFAAVKLAIAGLNGASLAGLTLAANKGLYATGPGALATFDLSAQGRTFLAATTQLAQRAALQLVKQTALNDATAGSLLLNGAHGLGTDGSNTTNAQLPTFSANVPTGFYRCFGTSSGTPTAGAPFTPNTTGMVLAITTAANLTTYVVVRNDTGEVWTGCYRGTLDAWKPLALAGANSSITSLSGLTTALSIAQGGTGNTTGLAATATALATTRSIAATGDATWSVNFNGSANATAAITLAVSGVTAGTYGSVTVNAKGLVTAASAATPVANGGTGATTATAAGTNLGTATVGTNTDQLARSSMIQAEIANKRAWTAYTPTLAARAGTYTSASATGKYMVAFGICHFQVVITITTVGTGTNPIFSLPLAALTGSLNMPIPAREGVNNGRTGSAAILTGLTTAEVTDSAAGNIVTANGSIIYVNGTYPVA